MSLTGPANPVSREISLSDSLIFADNPQLQSSLKENQRLTVKVVAVSGDKVVLNIGGKAVFAKTNIPLQVGATLTVEVRQSQEFPITLSLLASQLPAASVNAEALLGDLLSMMGQRTTPLAKGLIKELLEAGVPLDENKLRDALSMISSIKDEPLAIKGATFVMQHDLPINPSILKRVMAYLSARENMGNENPVSALVKAIHNFLFEMQTVMSDNDISVTSEKLKINLNNLLKQLNITTDSDSQVLMPQLSQIIQEAGTSLEAKLLAVAKAEITFFSLMEDLIENSNLPQELQKKLRILEEEFASILKSGDKLPDIRSIVTNNVAKQNIPEKILQTLMKQSDELTILHRDLATLTNEFRPTLSSLTSQFHGVLQTQAPPLHASSVSQLHNALQSALIHAEGEQLVNLALSSHPDQPQIIVSLPIGYPPGELPGELRIYSRPGKTENPINPKDVTIGFVLNTENMGKLSILLDIKDNNINGQLSVGREEIYKFIENHVYILRDKLKALAYDVGNLAVKIGEPDLLPIVVKNVDLKEITKIDIRV